MKKFFYCLSVVILLMNSATLAQDNSDPFKLNFYGPFLHSGVLPNTLFFIGEIKADDSFYLRKALRSHSVDTIVLDSPGGSVWEGLRIASIINDKGLNTYIPTGNTCASACSFMFFGGNIRMAEGNLGVHQFYSAQANQGSTIGASQETAQFTVSEIIGFLNEFRTPPFVYEKMFEAKSMYYFNKSEIEAIQNYQRSVASLGAKQSNAIKTLLDVMLRYYETKDANKQKPLVQPHPQSNPTKKVEPAKPLPIKPAIKKNSVVKAIQRELNRKDCNAGPEDGLMGTKTRNALKLFNSSMSNESRKYFAKKFGGVNEIPSSALEDPEFLKQLQQTAIKCEPLMAKPARSKTAQKVTNANFVRFKHWYENGGYSSKQAGYGRIYAIRITADCSWGQVNELWYAYKRGGWYHMQNPVGTHPDFADYGFNEPWEQSFFGKGQSKVYRKSWNKIEASGEGCTKINGEVLK